VFRFDQTQEPGVYQVRFAGLGEPDDADEARAEPPLVRYTVRRDPGESYTDLLGESAETTVRDWLGVEPFHAELAGLLRTMNKHDPGRELWQWFALAVLLLLLAEVALSGRITRSRQGTIAAGGISFGEKTRPLPSVR
jgi:hypothetical protein